MGKRGPLPTKRRVMEAATAPYSNSRVTCPSWLGRPGKRLWEQIVTQVRPSGLNLDLDQSLLVLLCRSYEDWESAARQVKKQGPVVTMPSGAQRPSPHIKIAHDSLNQYLRCAEALGLTPAARTRLLTNTPGNESKTIEQLQAALLFKRPLSEADMEVVRKAWLRGTISAEEKERFQEAFKDYPAVLP